MKSKRLLLFVQVLPIILIYHYACLPELYFFPILGTHLLSLLRQLPLVKQHLHIEVFLGRIPVFEHLIPLLGLSFRDLDFVNPHVFVSTVQTVNLKAQDQHEDSNGNPYFAIVIVPSLEIRLFELHHLSILLRWR